MWKRDLTFYRLLDLPVEELIQLGILCLGRVRSQERGWMELEMDAYNVEVLRRIDLDEKECRLLVGSPKLGLVVPAFIEQRVGNTCRISYVAAKLPETDQAFLLFQEAPFFLNRLRQWHLFSLERWGKDKEEEAKKNPTIQLLEATWGTVLPLEMGGRLVRERKGN